MVDPDCPEVSIQLDRILPDIHAMELSFGIAGCETPDGLRIETISLISPPPKE